MSMQAKQRLTPEEYLARERQAETKSEFYNGEMFAMAGASRSHNLIVGNVTGELRAQLRGRPCEVYPAVMRVKVSETGRYTYPDIVVVCGEPRFEDEHVDTLLNPTLIVEVLSPSTEAYDRGEKFAQYRKLGSLREYVMIAQDRFRIEHYVRQGEDQWLLSEASESGDAVRLSSIGCDLQLSEAYDRVAIAGAGEAR